MGPWIRVFLVVDVVARRIVSVGEDLASHEPWHRGQPRHPRHRGGRVPWPAIVRNPSKHGRKEEPTIASLATGPGPTPPARLTVVRSANCPLHKRQYIGFAGRTYVPSWAARNAVQLNKIPGF
jgi:hypothetical protein